jgi:hypothetical protein
MVKKAMTMRAATAIMASKMRDLSIYTFNKNYLMDVLLFTFTPPKTSSTSWKTRNQ